MHMWAHMLYNAHLLIAPAGPPGLQSALNLLYHLRAQLDSFLAIVQTLACQFVRHSPQCLQQQPIDFSELSENLWLWMGAATDVAVFFGEGASYGSSPPTAYFGVS